MLKEKPFKVKGLRKGKCFDCKVEDNLFKDDSGDNKRVCYTCLKLRLDNRFNETINNLYPGLTKVINP